jgi:hypothetical protein
MNVTVITSDKVELELTPEIYNKMNVIKHLIEDLNQDTTTEKIPINVNSDNLKTIIEYLEKHIDDDPISKEYLSDIYQTDTKLMTGWDLEFIKKFDRYSLEKIIEDAQYLDIRSIIDLCCYQYAQLINDMDESEFKQLKLEISKDHPDFFEQSTEETTAISNLK